MLGIDSKVMSIQPMLITLGPMPNLEQQRDLSPRARARARPRARMLLGGSKLVSIGFPEGPSDIWVQWGYSLREGGQGCQTRILR